MKISSAKLDKPDTSTTTSDQANPAADPAQQGVFDQLLQVLFTSMFPPAPLPAPQSATPTGESAGNSNTVQVPQLEQNEAASQTMQILSSQPVMQPAQPVMQQDATQDITQLMSQLSAGQQTNLEQVSPDQQTKLTQIQLADAKTITPIKAGMPSDQALKAPAPELSPTINNVNDPTQSQQQAMNNQPGSKEQQNQTNTQSSDMAEIKSTLPLQVKENLPQAIKADEKIKIPAHSVEIIGKSEEKVKVETKDKELAALASEMATTATTTPLQQPEVMSPHVEQHHKVMEAFTHMGALINDKAASLPAQANSLSTTTASSFNPHQDIQFLDQTTPNFHFQSSAHYDARIKIYPPELGNVIAKLKMSKEGAELVLMTENNHVKAIVEANLPALKQHFQQADIQLRQVNVETTQTNENRQQTDHKNREQFYSDNQLNDFTQANLPIKEAKINKDAIVDTYA